jgi:hypothetical protein
VPEARREKKLSITLFKTSGRFHKTFSGIIYTPLEYKMSKTLMEYADSGVNYALKSFMKLATGANEEKLFSQVIYKWPGAYPERCFTLEGSGLTHNH